MSLQLYLHVCAKGRFLHQYQYREALSLFMFMNLYMLERAFLLVSFMCLVTACVCSRPAHAGRVCRNSSVSAAGVNTFRGYRALARFARCVSRWAVSPPPPRSLALGCLAGTPQRVSRPNVCVCVRALLYGGFGAHNALTSKKSTLVTLYYYMESSRTLVLLTRP